MCPRKLLSAQYKYCTIIMIFKEGYYSILGIPHLRPAPKIRFDPPEVSAETNLISCDHFFLCFRFFLCSRCIRSSCRIHHSLVYDVRHQKSVVLIIITSIIFVGTIVTLIIQDFELDDVRYHTIQALVISCIFVCILAPAMVYFSKAII